jgi:hypothetical protein
VPILLFALDASLLARRQQTAHIYDDSFELYQALYTRTDDLMHGLTAMASPS